MARVPTSASPNDRLADELIYRERQHDLLACFGMTALRSTDVSALLQEATRLCAEGLRTPLCKALERVPGPDGEDGLIVRAGVEDRRMVTALVTKTALREGLDAPMATDITLALLSPELYHLLTARRGWDAARWEQWTADALVTQLLPPG